MITKCIKFTMTNDSNTNNYYLSVIQITMKYTDLKLNSRLTSSLGTTSATEAFTKCSPKQSNTSNLNARLKV